MPRNPDLEKVTLNLRRGDTEYLSTICYANGLTVSEVIRTLVSAKVDELRAKEPKMELPALD
jgi:hypothetical protein